MHVWRQLISGKHVDTQLQHKKTLISVNFNARTNTDAMCGVRSLLH